MIITNNNTTLSKLFEIEDGDIFLYEGRYYIAGEIDYVNHSRECFDLSISHVRVFAINYLVYAWRGCECELVIKG